jgi:esterase
MVLTHSYVLYITKTLDKSIPRAVALLQPERIEGIVAIDIAPVHYTNDEPHWKAVTDIIHALSSTQLLPGMTKRDVDIQLQSTIADPALRAFCLTNYDQYTSQWTVNLSSIGTQLNTLARFDVSFTNQYTGDAFFIHGGQSRFVRHKHMNEIATMFPNHMLTTVRG